MSQHLLEWQLIARTRPGTVDTSALPMDTISNPGTMNAIFNFARRPEFPNTVLKWRKASQCPGGAATCWCEPEKPGKCWERSEKPEMVQSILKGGEDSIGAAEAIQRVYFNIGSCAEQCWLNHLPDLRAIDPVQRNYGQTPLDIGQCRRDCASFRAIEDRLNNVVDFFLTARPADLAKARGVTPEALDAQLDQEFGAGSVALGAQVFGRTCARCHSSQANPSETTNFRVTDPADPTLRLDFLSNEKPIFASGVGTYAGRAMHSNHMATRVWDQYTSREVQQRPADPTVMEVMKGGGRGYYRPPSLLSVWAYAPFMLNNAIGPEVCGKPANKAIDFYSSPYVDDNDRLLANPPPCVPFDVSVDGRYRAVQAVDGSTAQSGETRAQGEPARSRYHHRHRVEGEARADQIRLVLAQAAQGIARDPDQQPALQGPVAGRRAAEARPRQARGEIQRHPHARAAQRADRESRPAGPRLLAAHTRQFHVRPLRARKPRSSRRSIRTCLAGWRTRATRSGRA